MSLLKFGRKPFAHANSEWLIGSLIGGVALWGMLTPLAQAVPSFSRQTGESCTACHVGGFGPQLTAHGMMFKLGGYTDSDGKEGHVPLSAMAVGSYTHTLKDLAEDAAPHFSTNNNAAAQEISAFLAGGLTDHIGTFVQATYSGIERQLALDNADVRYAQTVQLGGEDAIFGVTFNNNPTLQDPFNTIPAWRFPYMASELVPGPIASPLLDGGLSQQVLGGAAYGYWNNFYAELGAYGTPSASFLDKVNVANDAGSIKSLAPYYRLGYFKDLHTQAYAVGLFGLSADMQPDRASGPTNNYDDFGIDAWYQFMGTRKHIFSVYTAYIHENQKLNASFDAEEAERASASLNRFDLNASYHYDQTYGFTAGMFSITGDQDPTLYAPAPDSGSRTGKPDTTGFILQADWTPFGKEGSWGEPWANLRLGLQYTFYSKFNGASSDYDGFGRDASDNNTLFAFIWLAM